MLRVTRGVRLKLALRCAGSLRQASVPYIKNGRVVAQHGLATRADVEQVADGSYLENGKVHELFYDTYHLLRISQRQLPFVLA